MSLIPPPRDNILPFHFDNLELILPIKIFHGLILLAFMPIGISRNRNYLVSILHDKKFGAANIKGGLTLIPMTFLL